MYDGKTKTESMCMFYYYVKEFEVYVVLIVMRMASLDFAVSYRDAHPTRDEVDKALTLCFASGKRDSFTSFRRVHLYITIC